MPPDAPWHIHLAYTDDAPGCDAVRAWLRQHNWNANPEFMQKWQEPEHEEKPLVLLARRNEEVIGGLFARTQLSWLRISMMAVHPEWRRRGVGAALLAEAERMAAQCGCLYTHVDTMSYQAPEFYLKHGYRIAGELPDWDSHGHAKLHFIKPLTPVPFSS